MAPAWQSPLAAKLLWRLRLQAQSAESPEEIKAAGHPLVCADVTRLDELQSAHDTLIKHWGGIDLIVWVAGTYAPMQADTFELSRATCGGQHQLVGRAQRP